ncbi:DUF4352 domain-containing protein [Gordonia rubripertincta]|uniref:DUF4352 domain-containing protein n=1 Tax=Gordonia rubripertincta TaxID=36822 RepID=UPI00117FA6C3|nr:DUF4352 domain-containing protein [Gordonia rubripertincta]TSD96942.1 DUF4352 domain-containing protein [Gordonia rubripertincta]
MTHPQNPQAGQAYPGQPQAGQAPYPGQPYAQQPQYGVPGPYGAPPAYQAPIQPPKKKKWPWIVGILVALIVIIAAVSGGGDDSSDKTASSGSSNSGEQADSGGDNGDNGDNGDKKADEQAAGLNTPVRDGKFEFVVTNVESGLSSVGDNEFLTAEAQGQFVVVTMTVNNTSKEPKDFSPTNQKLVDTEGRSFEPDTTAQIYLGGSDIPVWDNINPGNTVEVKVVYDMPVDAMPASIELHDSMFSGGVKVNLG